MAGVLDDIGDLIKSTYNAATGASQKATNDKSEASTAPADDWVQRAKQKAQADSSKSVDDQVAANGG